MPTKNKTTDTEPALTLPRNFHLLPRRERERLLSDAADRFTELRENRMPPTRVRKNITAEARRRLHADRAAFEEDAASRRRFEQAALRDANRSRHATAAYNPFDEDERFGDHDSATDELEAYHETDAEQRRRGGTVPRLWGNAGTLAAHYRTCDGFTIVPAPAA